VLTPAGLLFLALGETAFGLLMRLPQRLEAERATESSALSVYLEDPIKFFVPARLMRGRLLILLMVLLADAIGSGFPAWLILFGSGVGIMAGVGQMLPAQSVARSPERFLELLLPAFAMAANIVGPFTALIVAWTGPPAPRNDSGDRA